MTHILLVGFAAQDFVFGVEALPSGGVKHRAQALDVVGGGLSGNAAVAIARLGGKARLITRLGEDSVGRDIVAELEGEGVDCSGVRYFPGHRSPLSAIAVDRAGERMILSYSDASIPAAPDWLPATLPADVDAVMGDTRWEEGARFLFRAARAAGKPAVLDGDRAVADADTVRSATHVAWSAQAIRETTGRDDVCAALAQTAKNAANWMAVTDGPRGVWFVEEGAIAHQPAFPVNAVDTLGAGDTFHGALTLVLAEGLPPRAAVRFASAAAALKCTRFGGRRGAPSRSEVDHFLRGA